MIMHMLETSGLEGLSRAQVREWVATLPVATIDELVPVWPAIVLPEPVAGEPMPIARLAADVSVDRATAALSAVRSWAGVGADIVPGRDGLFYHRDSGEHATVRECARLGGVMRHDWAAALVYADMVTPPSRVQAAVWALAAERLPGDVMSEARVPVMRHHRTQRAAYAMSLSGQLVELAEGVAECREVARGLTLPGPRADWLRACGRTRLSGHSLECLAGELWPGQSVISLASGRADEDYVAVGAPWGDWGTLGPAGVVSGLPIVEYGGHTGREDSEPAHALIAETLLDEWAIQRMALAYRCPTDVAAAALLCWAADEYDTRQQAQRMAWRDLEVLRESGILSDPHDWGASDYISAYLAAHTDQPVVVPKPCQPDDWHVIESNRWAARRAAMAAYRKVAELA